MATIAEVVEGLQILAKTAEIPRGLAEKGVTDGMQALVDTHNKILIGPCAAPSKEDEERLVELGWLYSRVRGCWTRYT